MKKLKTVFINAQGRTIGEDHHRAKLTDADVDLIFALRDAGLSYAKIAEKFDDIPGGINHTTVFHILHGNRRGQSPDGQRKRWVRVAAPHDQTGPQPQPPMRKRRG